MGKLRKISKEYHLRQVMACWLVFYMLFCFGIPAQVARAVPPHGPDPTTEGPLGDGFIHVSDPVAYADADFNGDGKVDMADFAVFAEAWLTTSTDAGYHPECDVFLDDLVNMKDFVEVVQSWLDGVTF